MLPRILVLDDLFGRNTADGKNPERESLCAHFLWQDVTNDAAMRTSRQRIMRPSAEVVFARAQRPSVAGVGDTVENSVDAALEAVREGWPQNSAASAIVPRWSLVLLDLCFYTGPVTERSDSQASGMPEGLPGDDEPDSYFGLRLLKILHDQFPELPVVVLSSKPREDVSLEMSRRGALGFIARDDPDARRVFGDTLSIHGLIEDGAGTVVGSSLSLMLALREARRASRHRNNVLIRGERGTGKELFAKYIHGASGYAKRAFIPVNSAVLSTHLFASELFGIEPRTATGVDGKIGLIEAANEGDLFLDEIGDMPLDVQAAVLRVLQERQITRVGARRARDVDVRFLSATNVVLEESSVNFRADLLDRLRLGGMLWLPPLRERVADIASLTEKFIHDAEATVPNALHRTVTSEALEKLYAYAWPGNVRELRSVVIDAVSRHPDAEHLVPEHLRIPEAAAAAPPRVTTASPIRAEASPIAVDVLLASLSKTEFDSAAVGEWAGKLHSIEREHARLVARMVKAALDATKRRTASTPDGTVQIHPAMKLLTGDRSLSASRAADLLKRLLRPIENELNGDLRVAYDTALRLRPKSSLRSR